MQTRRFKYWFSFSFCVVFYHLSAYCVPSEILTPLQVVIHLIHKTDTTIPWSGYYYFPHFTNEKIEA